MVIINTRTLDHIIYLTRSLEETSQQFRDVGFNVLPGGIHEGGLTENALVVFEDGVYLELISFTQPASHYTPGSEESRQRERHQWATKSPGWIDYAFLGNDSRSESISELINQRGREDGSGDLYEPEQEGGRRRPDGQVLKWLISPPRQWGIAGIPFFCGDVTPRYLRVPSEPPENVRHPSTATGIAYLRILVQHTSFNNVRNHLKTVIGHDPISSTTSESIWTLDTPNNVVQHPLRLILSIPNNVEETAFIQDSISNIYEIGFRVHRGSKKGNMSPAYGRVAWVEEE